MEENQEVKNNKSSLTEAQIRSFKIIAFVVVFALPVAYLYVKSRHVIKASSQSPAATQAAKINNVTELENKAKTDPSFDNLINLSLAYINNGSPGRSIPYLNKALELKPSSAVVYNNLGVAYTMTDQYQNGIDACTMALQIDSTFQLAKNNLKWANDEKSKTMAAINTEENTPAKDRDARFYIGLGYNYYKTGNYDKSLEIWQKALALNPTDPATLNDLGTVFMMKKQYDKAIDMFSGVVKADPGNQLGKNNLAWAQDEKNKATGPFK